MGRIDRNTLLGIESFVRGAAERGLHAVIGVEFDLASPVGVPSGSLEELTSPVTFPIVLYAETDAGYRNLVRLVTRAHSRAGAGATGSPAAATLPHPHERRGSGRPYLVLSDLEEHHHGLIARSPGLTGEVSTWIMRGQADLAERLALRLAEVFGRSSFYLGLSLYGHTLETRLAHHIADLARRTGLSLIEANEMDHLDPGDAPVRDLLAAIAAGAAWSPEKSGGSTGPASHFRAPSDLAHLFREFPEALEAAGELARRCQVDPNRFSAEPLRYPMPSGRSQDAYLESLCEPGPRSQVYRDRLDRELDAIHDLGLSGTFLYLRDLARYARGRNMNTGPGFGLLTHSLVAFRLGLTEVDPVVHGLPFERFESEARTGAPELVLDLDRHERAEIRAWAAQRFAGLVTMPVRLHRFTPAEAVRRAGEAMGFGQEDIDRTSGVMPDEYDGDVTQAIIHNSRLARRYRQDERVRTWLDLARRLVGLSSCVEEDPTRLLLMPAGFENRIPVSAGASGLRPAQIQASDAVRTGYVLVDLGGNRRVESLSALESTVRAVRPRCMSDMVSAVNLCRIEASGRSLTELFVRRRNGEEGVHVQEPALAEVLEPTEGLLLDQEQLVAATIAVTGFSPESAEQFRRHVQSISNGDPASAVQLGPWRHRFVEAAVRRGMVTSRAEGLFQSMVHAGRGLPDRAGSVVTALLTSRAALTSTRSIPARVSDLPRPAVADRTRSSAVAAGRGERNTARTRIAAASVVQMEMPWAASGTEQRTGTDGSR